MTLIAIVASVVIVVNGVAAIAVAVAVVVACDVVEDWGDAHRSRSTSTQP